MANLYVFHMDQDGNQQIWYTYSPDATNWAPDTRVPNVGMVGPSAVAWAGGIAVFHEAQNGDQRFGTRIRPMAQTGAQMRKCRTSVCRAANPRLASTTTCFMSSMRRRMRTKRFGTRIRPMA